MGGMWHRIVRQGRENGGNRLLSNVDRYFLHYVVHMTEGSNSNIFYSVLNVFVFNLHNQLYMHWLCSTNVSKSPACSGTLQESSSGTPLNYLPNMGSAGLNRYLGFESVSGWPLESGEDCRAATRSLHGAGWNILSSVLKICVLDYSCVLTEF